jgi:hypothetical protein
VSVTKPRFNNHQSLQEFIYRIPKKAQLRCKQYWPWRLGHSSRYSNSLWPRSHGVESLMWENDSVRRTHPHQPWVQLILLQRVLGFFLGIRFRGVALNTHLSLVELHLHSPFVPSRYFTDRTSLFASFHAVINKNFNINNVLLMKTFIYNLVTSSLISCCTLFINYLWFI